MLFFKYIRQHLSGTWVSRVIFFFCMVIAVSPMVSRRYGYDFLNIVFPLFFLLFSWWLLEMGLSLHISPKAIPLYIGSVSLLLSIFFLLLGNGLFYPGFLLFFAAFIMMHIGCSLPVSPFMVCQLWFMIFTIGIIVAFSLVYLSYDDIIMQGGSVTPLSQSVAIYPAVVFGPQIILVFLRISSRMIFVLTKNCYVRSSR